jgi:hypothetical protein
MRFKKRLITSPAPFQNKSGLTGQAILGVLSCLPVGVHRPREDVLYQKN